MSVKHSRSSVINSPYVRDLELAENVFLEVLLSNFILTRERRKAGVHLKVAFDGSTPATWNRDGRGSVREWMKDAFRASSRSKPSKADLYQQELDAILFEGKPGTFAPSDKSFLWRWASGGTLPVISVGKRSYYCLFFRDIFPIGWNIANGACDTRNELLDPLQALEREFAEELGVVNPDKRTRYVLNPEEHPALDRAEFVNYRRLWQKQFPRFDLLNFRSEGLAFTWEHGPDQVTVRTGRRTNKLTDCFVNINTLDFGIELDRIARIAVTDDEVLCDLDVNDKKDRVLNRPVGLFDVERLQKELRDGNGRFIPDKFFHSGKVFDGSKLEQRVKGAVTEDVRSWRRSQEIADFEETSNKFDLCPVTRSLVRRHKPETGVAPSQKGRMGPGKQSDVFISFAEPDGARAYKVFEFVKGRSSRPPFFAPVTLAGCSGRWGDAIDSALQSATSLIAIASKSENLERGWVRYETRAFHQLHGADEDARIIPFISGFNPLELPMPLRLYQALQWGKGKKFDAALEQLWNRIS